MQITLNWKQANIGLQVLLTKQHAAFIRALRECVCVDPNWTFSVCKDPQDLGRHAVQCTGSMLQKLSCGQCHGYPLLDMLGRVESLV